MRALWVGLAVLLLPVQALAQGGMGGMGGDMGGGMAGGMAGGMNGPGGGPPGGGPGGGRPREMKPIKREKLDKPVEAMFRMADSDGDGIVTLQELRAVLEARRDEVIRARFVKIDTNGNKLIEPAEFIAWQRQLGSAALSERDADIGPVGEALPLGTSESDMMLEQLIEPLSATVIVNANSNYDRGISLEELLAYQRKRFDGADANQDGELSPEEMRSLMPDRKERGPGGPGGPGGRGGPPPQDGAGPPQGGN